MSPENSPDDNAPADKDSSNTKAPVQATVIVRGEAVKQPDAKTPADDKKNEAASKPLSEAKVKMQGRLPALDDDADVGIAKAQVVTRDGKADLAFTGTLLASAAPVAAPKGEWQEYRVYETDGGKHVFSKISRNVAADAEDTHEAEVFDPAPSSVPSQLLRTARDLTRSHPLTWTDAAISFFGYDPLAKTLYSKLKFPGAFEERI